MSSLSNLEMSSFGPELDSLLRSIQPGVKKMQRGLLTMSQKEIDRVAGLKQLSEKHLKQNKAAELLKLSTRQIRRMVQVYRQQGIKGLVSKRRGTPGNHHHKKEVKENAKHNIQRYYADFGPTLASEKLKERHGIEVNKETLRQWMMEWDLWKADLQKHVKVHQCRQRRACVGELVQLDGSPHDWFEDRGERC